MKTSEQIKCLYRVCEINDRFYIQEKTILGWSCNTRKDYDATDYPSFPGFFMFFTFTFLALFIVSIGVAIFKNELNIGLLIMPIFCVIFLSSYLLSTMKSKKLSHWTYTLKDAEKAIDNFVYNKLREQKKKEVKYHYFYTTQQMRKEKLNNLK